MKSQKKMRHYTFFLRLSLTIVLALIVLLSIKTVLRSNLFSDLDSRRFECRVVDLPRVVNSNLGAEDIVAIGENLILSRGDHRSKTNLGNLTLFDLKKRVFSEFSGSGKPRINIINPHGMSAMDASRFIVIDHPNESGMRGKKASKTDQLKILRIVKSSPENSNGDFQYTLELERVIDAPVSNLNDVTWVNKNRFFMTQDHTFKSDTFKLFENILGFPGGNILFFDGKKFRKAYSGVLFANGIVYSKKYQKLFVSSMIEKRIYYFRVDSDFKLHLDRIHDLDFFPDNLTLTGGLEEQLLIAGHQKIFQLKELKEQNQTLSPWKVVQIDLENGNQETLLSGSGDCLSAVSVALKNGPDLWLGTIFSPKIGKISLQ